MRKLILTTIAIALTASVASADTCDLEASLAAQGKELTHTISVRRADRETIAAMGITLRNGLLGSKYIQTADLLAYLAANGCEGSLVDWAVSSTKKPRSTGGQSGSSSGNSGGSSSGGSSGIGDDF